MTSNLLETRRRCTYTCFVCQFSWKKEYCWFLLMINKMATKKHILFLSFLNTIKEQNHSSVYTWAWTPENLSLGFANNEQHPHRLISAFVIRLLENIISKLATSKFSINFLASVCNCAGCFGFDLVGNPKDRFSCNEALIILWWDMILSLILFFSLWNKSTINFPKSH